MAPLPDYKEVREVDGVEVAYDEQVPIEERVELDRIHIDQMDLGTVELVDEFPEIDGSFMGEGWAIFHTGERKGFIIQDGRWYELTSLTDFFRAVQDAHNPRITVQK